MADKEEVISAARIAEWVKVNEEEVTLTQPDIPSFDWCVATR